MQHTISTVREQYFSNTSSRHVLLMLMSMALGMYSQADAFVIRPVSSHRTTFLPSTFGFAFRPSRPLWTSPKPVFPQVSEGNETICDVTTEPGSQDFVTEELNQAPEFDEGLSGDDDLHWFRFGGVGRLYEDDENSEDAILERLKHATVAIVGMGGIGSWTAEALCRSGIGNLVLIDLDDICISNTNRQIHTLATNVGSMKTDVMRDRLVGINPFVNITLIHDFIMLDNVQEIVGGKFKELNVDIVVDSIDGDEDKAALIAACADYGFPVVTTGSPSGKSDPTLISRDDLTQAQGDDLLRACRHRLVEDYDFTLSEGQAPWNVAAVYSRQGAKESNLAEFGGAPAASFRNDGATGAACFVTGTFGFVTAARVVETIVDENLTPPKRA